MEFSFRKAEHSDCYILANIKKEVWNTTYRGIYNDELLDNFDTNKQTDKFKKMVDSKTNLYVVESNNKIIGYFSFGKPYHPYSDYEIEFGLLYLLKEYQVNGIGTAIFKFVKDEIKKMGVNKFYLCCNKYNYNAQKFYEKMGGVIVHIDPDDIEKDRIQIYYEYKI